MLRRAGEGFLLDRVPVSTSRATVEDRQSSQPPLSSQSEDGSAQCAASTPSAALRLSSLPWSCFIGAALAFVVFWTGAAHPLPLRLLTALFLLGVVQQDLLRNKIPNALTFPAFALALVLAALSPAGSGVAAAMMGAGTVFGVLFIPFALRFVGAGDVKALMVLGALTGGDSAWELLVWTTVLSGCVGLLVLLLRGGGREMLGRWAASLGVTFATRRATYFRAPMDATARSAHPKGVAIALGVMAMQIWGSPWISA